MKGDRVHSYNAIHLKLFLDIVTTRAKRGYFWKARKAASDVHVSKLRLTRLANFRGISFVVRHIIIWGIFFVLEQGVHENNILFLYSNALACLEKRCWLVVCFCGFQPRMGLRQLAPSCSVGLLILENPYH